MKLLALLSWPCESTHHPLPESAWKTLGVEGICSCTMTALLRFPAKLWLEDPILTAFDK
jgi:hypothetical protein